MKLNIKFKLKFLALFVLIAIVPFNISLAQTTTYGNAWKFEISRTAVLGLDSNFKNPDDLPFEELALRNWTRMTEQLFFAKIFAKTSTGALGNPSLETYGISLTIRDSQELMEFATIARRLVNPSGYQAFRGAIGIGRIATAKVTFSSYQSIQTGVARIQGELQQRNMHVSGGSTRLNQPLVATMHVEVDSSLASADQIFLDYHRDIEKELSHHVSHIIHNLAPSLSWYPRLFDFGNIPIEQFEDAGTHAYRSPTQQGLPTGERAYAQMLDFVDRLEFLKRHFGTMPIAIEFEPRFFDTASGSYVGNASPTMQYEVRMAAGNPLGLMRDIRSAAWNELNKTNPGISLSPTTEVFLRSVQAKPVRDSNNLFALPSPNEMENAMKAYLVTYLDGTAYTDSAAYGQTLRASSKEVFNNFYYANTHTLVHDAYRRHLVTAAGLLTPSPMATGPSGGSVATSASAHSKNSPSSNTTTTATATQGSQSTPPQSSNSASQAQTQQSKTTSSTAASVANSKIMAETRQFLNGESTGPGTFNDHNYKPSKNDPIAVQMSAKFGTLIRGLPSTGIPQTFRDVLVKESHSITRAQEYNRTRNQCHSAFSK